MTLTLRRLAKTAQMSALGQVREGPLFLAGYVLRLLRVVVLLSLWRTILAGKGPVGGMSLQAVLAYTLVSEAFAEVLAVRTSMVDAFFDGSITPRFLRPLSVFGQFAAETAGRWLLGFCLFSVPLLACAPLLGVRLAPAGPQAAFLFPLSLALAVSVGLALDYVFGAWAVGTGWHPWAIMRIRLAIAALLSGAVIPLPLLPWGLGKALTWLPFAATAAAPLQVWTGVGDPWALVGLQTAWSAALWPLAGWMWRATQERMVSYGG